MKFKYLVVAAVAFTAVVYTIGTRYSLLPSAKVQTAAVPKQFNLPSEAPVTPDAPVRASGAPEHLPATAPAPRRGSTIRIETIPWNATMGLQYAIGGIATMKNSLMDAHGLTVELKMVKDSMVSQQAQVKFASAVAAGSDTPADGPAFVIIMGDGSAQYLAGINKLLAKLGPDYYAENVGHVGYSRGEDGCWGKPEWRDNPEAMKGGAFAGVLRDGDWNICLYKFGNDGIKNNPDEHTWDPDAVNWFAADDFEKAVEMYVTGYCEDRPVVRNGKITTEPKHHVCVEGVATWTPADVTLAHKKGGLVRLLSTKENAFQMPATLIGIHKWDVAHAKQVEELLAAAFEGADQVKASDDALQRAARASFTVYGEETPAYWAKYYKGTRERDLTGQPVELGGSTVANLADNLVFYGLTPGAGGPDGSLWRATYEGFGNISKQQYPRLVPDFPKYTQAFNPMFIQALAQRSTVDIAKAELPKFDEAPIEKSAIVGKRNWTITFDTGKASFTPQAEAVLRDLYTQLLNGGALAVEIDGHTDNAGNPAANQALSELRAFAVKDWLEHRAPSLFPTGRVQARGFGDTVPVAPNATAEGRAQNRRVTVILGTK
jgi:OOP family OmpA-OmpF porin